MIFMSQDGEGHKHFHPEWIYFKIGWSLNHIIVSSHIGANTSIVSSLRSQISAFGTFSSVFIHQNRDLQPRLSDVEAAAISVTA